MIKNSLLFFLLFTFSMVAQDSSKNITVIGNELMGRIENGESVREVTGNVILTQDNVVITCDRAIQYLERNDAHLIGNVIITQDTLTIETPEGYYFGNDRRAFSEKGVRLNDKKVILTAQIGEYLFDLHKANFSLNVSLYDTLSTLTSDTLIYYRKLDKAIATGNVKIVDKENIIEADSLTHFRTTQITHGFNNIRIENKANNTVIYGAHIEDYRLDDFSVIDINPILIQIDTSSTNSKQNKELDSTNITALIDSISLSDSTAALKDSIRIDTLIIKSKVMEAFRGNINLFIARDSVEIIRGGFVSKNDFTHFYRNEDKIVTAKINDDSKPPVMWYENTQLSGDSLTIYLVDNQIDRVLIRNNSLIVSVNDINPKRYDQISGKNVNLIFNEDGLYKTEVFENVLSIYNVYDEGKENGLIKASSKDAVIDFFEKKVDIVRLYGEPKSDYYPENLIIEKEMEFLIPKFILYKEKPSKEKILQNIKPSSLNSEN